LRVLQEGEIERVGGSRTLRTDVRVLAATNRDLFAMMRAGTFREDLYYRLAVLHVATPALDEHPEDIPELARHFVERSCRRNGRPPLSLTAEACDLLAARPYRGHVRELQNLVERLVILSESLDVDAVRAVAAIPEASRLGAGGYRPGAGLRELTQEAQRVIVERALRHHQGNMTAAARDLGLERSHLYKKCRALGLDTARRRATGA
jgi:DNA-binding NtrC family response regulator